MRIDKKSDAWDRFKFVSKISPLACKNQASGVFFTGNMSVVMDDICCGKIIVRDGRYDNDLFCEFESEETKKIESFTMPEFPNYCKNIFFLKKREVVRFLKGINLTTRKMAKSKIQVSVENKKIILAAYSKKHEKIKEIRMPLYINPQKKNNIHYNEGEKFQINFLYLFEIFLYSFEEYDIIGVRYNSPKEIYLFGKNYYKPNICWLLRDV